MEGRRIVSSKLKFVESKTRYKTAKVNGQSLIAAANNHGLAIIAVEKEIKAVSLDTLVQYDRTNTITCDLTEYVFSIPLSFKPSLITIARYGFSSVLLASGLSDVRCPVVEAIDLDSRTSIGKLDLTELTGSEIRDCAWHPNYFDSIAAVCTSRGTLAVLAIDKNVKGIAMVYNNSQYGALTCCWSPKGKNLAIGLSSGRIIRLEPVVSSNSFTFKEVDKSTFQFSHEKMTFEHQIVKLIWVNKTFLLCVHAKLNNPNGPDTIYSIITTRSSKPYLYWTNVVFENKVQPDYQVFFANLSNAVVCATNASGEAAVIGVDGAKQIGSSEVNDWNSIIIDEEGARIELPLDNDNRETYPVGVTLAFKSYMPDKPIIIFYTSDGVLCPYSATHTEDILKMPESQQPQECPISVLKSSGTNQMAQTLAQPFGSSMFGGGGFLSFASLAASVPPSAPIIAPKPTLTSVPAPAPTSCIDSSLKSTKKSSEFNEVFMGSLNNTNQLRTDAVLRPFGATQTDNTLKISESQQPQESLISVSKSSGTNQMAQTLAQPFGSSMFGGGGGGGGFLSFANLAASVPPSISSVAPRPTLTSAPALAPAPVSEPVPTLAPTPAHAPVPAPVSAPVPTSASAPVPAPVSAPVPTSASASVPASVPAPAPAQAPAPAPICIEKIISCIDGPLKSIKKSSEFNEVYMGSLDDINHLRTQVNEVAEFHMLHRQALDAIKADIDALDMEMLEALYLIEYIKSRRKTRPPKNTLDPMTVKKVDEIKQKSRQVAEKLRDINLHVDVTWENHLRTTNNKEPNSLQMIYKTLAVHQKIISVLKSKAASLEIKPPEKKKTTSEHTVLTQKNVLDPARIEAFRRFLASRNTVPVRHPVRLR